MKFIHLALQVGILVAFFYIGEGFRLALHLPVPGSIIGMLLLWALLMLKWIPVHWIAPGATFVQRFMPFIFIPATVGVMQFGATFAGKGMLLVACIIVSTLITMAVSGATSQSLAKRLTSERKDPSS
ncbi:CidA/LrgA family protein [Paenibacillus senegalensis]|uniref:CidA/LrgA family protein n=1 Tax=Paenibacillus senegalensis TaxID=1465766 RepID=UPI0002897058|nr:CidA/LrgA family protein [Paenibacillus senegalensis]